MDANNAAQRESPLESLYFDGKEINTLEVSKYDCSEKENTLWCFASLMIDTKCT